MQTRLTMNNVINLPNGRELNLIEPVIMGILNVTPDSFSDGGKFIDPSIAVQLSLIHI